MNNTKPTYTELMYQIEQAKNALDTILEDDCIGDMMVYLDERDIRYHPDSSNDTIRLKYKYTVLREINSLHTQAMHTLERELLH